MSITHELREWISSVTWLNDGIHHTCDKITAIADRIDAEHQKALDEWKVEHGQMWLKGYAECHAELFEGNETLASDLESCGWIRLPKDADGEYIHIGDVMENLREDLEPPLHRRFRVYGIRYRDHERVCALTEEGYPSVLYRANECRHYHVTTVEDVLDEFASAYDRIGGADEEHQLYLNLIAEYAKRLTLAEGED